ncbi:MAG: thioredoxin [Planctomycetaceae bacterium]|nr:thioredoxin [Planctomycetaceae bacterium]
MISQKFWFVMICLILFESGMSIGCRQDERILPPSQEQNAADYDKLAAESPSEPVTVDDKGFYVLDDANFMEAVGWKDGIVIVDFWIDGCAPCEGMEKTLAGLVKDYKENIRFARIHVNRHQIMAQKYKVFAFPTLAIFSRGEYLGQLQGYREPLAMRNILDKLILEKTTPKN